MLKRQELLDPKSCLNKAAPDEPVFVLRAKDAAAAQTVRLWAAMAGHLHESAKVEEALKLADQMGKWRQAQGLEPPSSPKPAPAALQDGVRPTMPWGDALPGAIRT